MSERETSTAAPAQTRLAAPGAAELLRAALEKIVFFEWRLSEIASELAAAQARAASAEQERSRAEGEAAAALQKAQAARHQLAGLESERARLASLLSRPQHHAADSAALEAERDRTAQLAGELADARRELQRAGEERARLLTEMTDQARQGDEAPAALAQFISELRGEVIALRERQRQCDALLTQAGVAPPASADLLPPPSQPSRDHDAVSAARKLWAEGRLGGVNAELDQAAARAALEPGPVRAAERGGPALPPPRSGPQATDLLPGMAALRASPPGLTARDRARPTPDQQGSAAARALAEQCLRGLASRDAARRAQAARHLAALPFAAAAPALAAALGREDDPRARAAIARALATCGGDGAIGMVGQLFAPGEPALVRMAALEALASGDSDRARTALEAAALDSSPALRRRAASLAAGMGEHADLLARLAADPDASVRAAAQGTEAVEVAPTAPPHAAPPAPPPAAPPAAPPAPRSDVPVAPLAADSIAPPPRPEQAAPLAGEAILAVRTAIFGLTEAELAAAVGVSPSEAAALAARLVAEGRLARRGRRLIAGSADEPAQQARAERGA